jgi:hypothetical protein
MRGPEDLRAGNQNRKKLRRGEITPFNADLSPD